MSEVIPADWAITRALAKFNEARAGVPFLAKDIAKADTPFAIQVREFARMIEEYEAPPPPPPPPPPPVVAEPTPAPTIDGNGFDLGVPLPDRYGHVRKSKPRGAVRLDVENCPVNGSKFYPAEVVGKTGLANVCLTVKVKTGREFATRKVTENGVEGYRFWRLK